MRSISYYKKKKKKTKFPYYKAEITQAIKYLLTLFSIDQHFIDHVLSIFYSQVTACRNVGCAHFQGYRKVFHPSKRKKKYIMDVFKRPKTFAEEYI